MSRIERLTAEQSARMSEFRDKWLAIGLSTERADRANAEAGIVKAYLIARLPAPKIVWCGSPLGAGLTRAILQDKRVGASVGASVGDSVGASVWDSGYGQHDAAWLGFYEYFHDVCGLVLQSEKLAGLWMVAKSAGWFLPHQNICWISERHNICKLDDRGRIHSEAGPSIAYPDGFAIFAWRGVRVPRQVIDSPDSLKPEQIRDEQNAEVRRVMMTRFGEARYLQGIGGKKIHEDELGELFLAEVPGDEPLVMVKVINSTPEPDGSRKPYFLRVPPDMRVASQAVAWTFGYENWQQYAENLVAQT